LRNADTGGQHADARTCVSRLAAIAKSKDEHIAVQSNEIRALRLERVAIVPLLTEGRRIAREDYCGATLLDSALRCGMRKGHDDRTHHKASAESVVDTYERWVDAPTLASALGLLRHTLAALKP
jgi:hypothetical protein